MMQRIPEPELMADEQQAAAYAAADLTELQQGMVDCFRSRFTVAATGRLLDLGCGAADMTIRFIRACPGWQALGVDGSSAMLNRGQAAVEQASLQHVIRLEQRYLPDETLPEGDFDVVIANSVLHHLPDPGVLWQTMMRCVRPGGAVMMMDLRRPAGFDQARELVGLHGAEAPPVLQQDFLNSLCAAYTAAEIGQQLRALNLLDFQVQEMGDLHVLAWGRRPC